MPGKNLSQGVDLVAEKEKSKRSEAEIQRRQQNAINVPGLGELSMQTQVRTHPSGRGCGRRGGSVARRTL